MAASDGAGRGRCRGGEHRASAEFPHAGRQQRNGSHRARTRAVVAAGDSIARCIFVGRDRRRAVDWSRGTADRSRGALGAAVGRTVKTSLNQTRVLVGARTAAGFAAAYNTPFAASLFVLETIAGIAAPELLLPVMAATVGAAGIMRATVGPGPIYGQRAFGLDSYAELLSFALLGIAAALVALAFKTVLAGLELWFDTHPVPQPFAPRWGGCWSAPLLCGCRPSWGMDTNR